MYEVIFFDLDHTLVDTRRQYHEGVPLALRRMYGKEPPPGFLQRFMYHHEQLWPLYDRRELPMTELRRERFLRAWRDVGTELPAAEADRFQAVYTATLPETLVAFPGTHELLAELAKHHRLGIITNGAPDLQEQKLRLTGLDRFFPPGTVVVSEQVGKGKPDPAVYRAALQALQVRAAKALMVGDHWQADVEGARACGLDALWYVPDPAADLDGQATEPPLRSPQALLAAIVARERTGL
ncbi:MAG: HAD family hydrolase [Alicyclobacillus sp.]|nr:HAD family hydrolase [Alicyclobacillus sp.]